MKKSICFLLLLPFIMQMNAQTAKNNAFYLSGELNAGNFIGINLNLNLNFNEKYSLQAGYSACTREAASIPDDFSSGILVLFTFGLSELILESMENYQVLFGKIYSLNDLGSIRLNLAGGIAYTVINEPSNWSHITSPNGGPNYTYDMKEYGTLSLIINPKFEFPFAKYIGITISPFLQTNFDKAFIGLGLGLMAGRLK